MNIVANLFEGIHGLHFLVQVFSFFDMFEVRQELLDGLDNIFFVEIFFLENSCQLAEKFIDFSLAFLCMTGDYA